MKIVGINSSNGAFGYLLKGIKVILITFTIARIVGMSGTADTRVGL